MVFPRTVTAGCIVVHMTCKDVCKVCACGRVCVCVRRKIETEKYLKYNNSFD